MLVEGQLERSQRSDSDGAAVRPLGRYGQLEVDAFCSGCGYNLHGQDVSMDERLAFLVCRCPECGRFHPAGTNTSANSIWLSRFGSVLLVIWVGIVLAVAGLATLAMAGLQAGYVNTFAWIRVTNPTQAFSGNWYYTLDPPSTADPMNIPGRGAATMLIVGALVLGFAVGTLMVSFLWHWPRQRYVFGVLMPILAAAVVSRAFTMQIEWDYLHTWCISRTWMIAAWEAAGIMLAIQFGRPLARVIVRTIVPPKPRQLLAFLWRADGKAMPATRQA